MSEIKVKKMNVNLWPYGLTLTAVFIVFKLCGVINWSWWLVLLPVIILSAFLALSCLFLLAVIAVEVRNSIKKERIESQEQVDRLKKRIEAMQKQAEELQRKKEEGELCEKSDSEQ